MLLKVGVFVNEYVTVPSVAVATVKLLLVDEAKKVYKLAIGVVAVTPLITDVIVPLAAEIVFEFMILDVLVIPFILLVKIFASDPNVLLFIIPAVVVDTTPFTMLVHIYELVLVETVSTFVVLDANNAAGVTCCTSPLGPSISIDEVADPGVTFVRVVVPRVAFVADRFVNMPVTAVNILENQFVDVPFIILEFTKVELVAVTELNIGLSDNV
jgi:hypothetical protein